MVCDETLHHPIDVTVPGPYILPYKIGTTLPYKLDTTTDKLTSRAGLLIVGQLMDDLSLSERIYLKVIKALSLQRTSKPLC